MSLFIQYISESEDARLTAGLALEGEIWSRLKDVVLSVTPNANLTATDATLPWAAFLQTANAIAQLKAAFGFEVLYDADARALLNKFVQERRALAAAYDSSAYDVETVEEELLAKGFARQDGELRSHQKRDIVRMASLLNGANFSVPGAGKTTVALAVHILRRDADWRLLVVAPKNAFAAWDTVVDECIPLDERSGWRFTRLVGGFAQITQLLDLAPRQAIISYDQLVRVTDVVGRYLAKNKVHVILDESHRIKAGERTQRGITTVRLAHLPIRRDILSGTPMPRSLEDVMPQVEFLWPGQGYPQRVRESSEPGRVLEPLYVRTTKGELGLTPPTRSFVPVSMSSPQLALYGLLRSAALARLRGLRDGGPIDLTAARRSVMRLLQVSSNPVLAVRRMAPDSETLDFADPSIRAIVDAIVYEEDSPKVLKAVQLARDAANLIVPEKTVIWTSFTGNVQRIRGLLSDVGAVEIHGGVNAGSELDEQTREGRIREFHRNPDVRVLVANPAACSEGISLHQVCHRAVYVDRSYNAAHYLQSVDRIHRLGLAADQQTSITVLESVAPSGIGSIDYSVRRRLITKLRVMASALYDPDLTQLAMDEEDADVPVDLDIEIEDLNDLIDELLGASPPPEGDEEI